MLVVYFSSTTENTKKFVDKLGLPSARIPLKRKDPDLIVDEPYAVSYTHLTLPTILLV